MVMNTEQQKQEIKKQQEQIAAHYRAKYPGSIGKTEKPETEAKLSVQDLQEQNKPLAMAFLGESASQSRHLEQTRRCI